MSAPYDTFLLSIDNWDFVFDASGNLAIATPPYSVAQDVSSAIRTFLGEVYYDSTLGVDYANILGERPPLAFLLEQMENAAASVPGVVDPVAEVTSFSDATRIAVGSVTFTDVDGNTQTVTV